MQRSHRSMTALLAGALALGFCGLAATPASALPFVILPESHYQTYSSYLEVVCDDVTCYDTIETVSESGPITGADLDVQAGSTLVATFDDDLLTGEGHGNPGLYGGRAEYELIFRVLDTTAIALDGFVSGSEPGYAVFRIEVLNSNLDTVATLASQNSFGGGTYPTDLETHLAPGFYSLYYSASGDVSGYESGGGSFAFELAILPEPGAPLLLGVAAVLVAGLRARRRPLQIDDDGQVVGGDARRG